MRPSPNRRILRESPSSRPRATRSASTEPFSNTRRASAYSDSQQRRGRRARTLWVCVVHVGSRPGQPPRPVMFVWNGGPADSTDRSLRRLRTARLRSPTTRASATTPVTVELYDNDATWLDFADLVFVDPVGTGFSRPTKAEYAAEFLNTLGDLASTAEFIRLYLTRFDLLNTPVFLAGESYGTWRASGAAEALEKKGVRVAGVILISGGVRWARCRRTRYARRCSSPAVRRPRSIIRSSHPSCCATRRRRSTKRANGR